MLWLAENDGSPAVGLVQWLTTICNSDEHHHQRIRAVIEELRDNGFRLRNAQKAQAYFDFSGANLTSTIGAKNTKRIA